MLLEIVSLAVLGGWMEGRAGRWDQGCPGIPEMEAEAGAGAGAGSGRRGTANDELGKHLWAAFARDPAPSQEMDGPDEEESLVAKQKFRLSWQRIVTM